MRFTRTLAVTIVADSDKWFILSYLKRFAVAFTKNGMEREIFSPTWAFQQNNCKYSLEDLLLSKVA